MQERLYFVQYINILVRENIKVALNLKKLYAADIQAAGELQKISQQLVEFQNIDIKNDKIQQWDFSSMEQKIQKLNNIRLNIITQGVNLIQLLGSQNYQQISPQINNSLAANFGQHELKILVDRRAQQITHNTMELETQIKTNRLEYHRLLQLFEQQKQSLEYITKRFEAMRTSIPPFIQELNENENKLRTLYAEYGKKQQCLRYISHQLSRMVMVQDQKKRKIYQDKVALAHTQDTNRLRALFKISDPESSNGYFQALEDQKVIKQISDPSNAEILPYSTQNDVSGTSFASKSHQNLPNSLNTEVSDYTYEEYEEETSSEQAMTTAISAKIETSEFQKNESPLESAAELETDLQTEDLTGKVAQNSSKTTSIINLSQTLQNVEQKIIEGIIGDQKSTANTEQQSTPRTPQTNRISRRQNLRTSSKLGSSRISTNKESFCFVSLSEGNSEYSYDLEEESEDEKKQELDALPYEPTDVYSGS